LNVGRMIELHVCRGAETIHALPRNILASVKDRGQLLNFRAVLREERMASHANSQAGQSGHRPLSYPLMTGRTLNLVFGVLLVGESDWLNRFSAPTYEVLNCLPD
jgi:hypothetical protein